MSRLPDPPERTDGGRCNGPKCERPRIHLGMTDRGDVWLCAVCDVGAGTVLAGPPRLVAYLKSGDRS
jgi:hypothetical protein